MARYLTWIFLSFFYSTFWIFVVHRVDKFALKQTRMDVTRAKQIFRIGSACFVTLISYLITLVILEIFGNKRTHISDYYGLGVSTWLSTLKIAALNTVLFAGNHYINFVTRNHQKFEKFEKFDFLDFLTKILVCPFLEEALFTTLSYHVYI